ncbi:MAG: DUF1569 domain-containing protein [Pirellulaceae bacterium]
MKRRNLDLTTGAEVIAEINRLRSTGYSKTKNWNLAQICQHLSVVLKGGMDGFGFRLPWILRATVLKWGFGYMTKKRKLFPSAPTFPSMKPKAMTEDNDADIQQCIALIERAETFDGSMEDYALLDNMTPDAWREFMWIHAAHHLSYLVPKQSRQEAKL